jgi:hypothetical protein
MFRPFVVCLHGDRHCAAQDEKGRFVNYMTTTMSDRLKQARVTAGFYKASDAIKKFGWKASTYRAHESQQNQFDAATALNYARAYGVNAGWLLTGEGEMSVRYKDAASRAAGQTMRLQERPASFDARIPIRGAVASGVWIEERLIGDSSESFRASPFPPDPAYPVDSQDDFTVGGSSFNKIAQPGDNLRCVDLHAAGLEAADGDLVILERRASNGLIELSARRMRRAGEVIEFWAESTDPMWRSPIIVSHGLSADGLETRVLAKVIWKYMKI